MSICVVCPGGSGESRLGATTLYSPQLVPPRQTVPPRLPKPLTNLRPPMVQFELPMLVMVMGSVLVLPTTTFPNCSTRPPNPPKPVAVGETLTVQTGSATGEPVRVTESAGRSGSLESNSSVPLSVALVSAAGGMYETMAVNASPGRRVTALVGGERTEKSGLPALIFTAVRLQSAAPRLATVTVRCALWPRTTCPNETLETLASRWQVGGSTALPRSVRYWSACASLPKRIAPR